MLPLSVKNNLAFFFCEENIFFAVRHCKPNTIEWKGIIISESKILLSSASKKKTAFLAVGYRIKMRIQFEMEDIS